MILLSRSPFRGVPRTDLVRPGRRWFRFLLCLYPAAFRREFGDEMLDVFLGELGQRSRNSLVRHGLFWLRTTAVTLWCALTEHAATLGDIVALRAPHDRRAGRERRFAAIRAQLAADVREALGSVEKRRAGSFAMSGLAAGLAAVVLAALGIARAGLFSVPYPGADRLVSIESAFLVTDYQSFPLSGAEFVRLKAEATSYEAIGAWAVATHTIKRGGRQTRERVVWATPGAFETFGLDRPEIRQADEPRPVYASEEFWRDQLSADPRAVGQTVTLNGIEARLAGVLPRSFKFWIDDVSLWIPFEARPIPGRETNHALGVVARIASDVSLDEARQEAEALTAAWSHDGPSHGIDLSHPLRVHPLGDRLAGSDGPPMRLLSLLAGGLLLLGFVHLAGMGRSSGTQKARLRPQFLARGFLVTAGGIVGLCGAILVLVIWSQARFGPFASEPETGVGGTLIFFAVTLLAALAATGAALHLKAPRRLGAALAALDLAATVGLLFGAGLLVRSATSLAADDPGFDPRGLIAFEAAIPGERSSELDARTLSGEVALFSASLPGVERVALSSGLPVTLGSLPSDVLGSAAGIGGETSSRDVAYTYFVSPGYTDVLGAPLLAGRRIEAPGEAVLSATLASRMWPESDALGALVHSNELDDDAGYARVVGVVADIEHQVGPVRESAQLYMSRDFLPSDGQRERHFTVLVRTEDSRKTAARLPAELVLRGTLIPISRPIQVADRQQLPVRKQAFLIGILAGAALLCLALGLFTARHMGTDAHCRTRLAKTLLPGLAAGFALALGIRSFLDPLLLEARGPDAAVFLVVAVSVGAAVLLAAPSTRNTSYR